MTGPRHLNLSSGPVPTAPSRAVRGAVAGERRIDTSVPHPARRYNYWCGGKDHFPADRASGDAIATAFPAVVAAANENRGFLHRAVRYLTNAGVRQFLDVGAGIPLAPNTHEIAQAIAADNRIVYLDNDPMVLAHARALLTSGPLGATACLDADLREPATILGSAELLGTLDLGRPVGLLLVAVLHFLTDDEAARAVAELTSALAPGSFVVLSHGTSDFMTDAATAELPGLQRHDPAQYRPRSRSHIARFINGLNVIDPTPEHHRTADVTADQDGMGLVSVARWRRDPTSAPCPSDEDVACYGVVAQTARQRPTGATSHTPSQLHVTEISEEPHASPAAPPQILDRPRRRRCGRRAVGQYRGTADTGPVPAGSGTREQRDEPGRCWHRLPPRVQRAGGTRGPDPQTARGTVGGHPRRHHVGGVLVRRRSILVTVGRDPGRRVTRTGQGPPHADVEQRQGHRPMG